ncbi:hypothetical protein V495_01631 [Pseudogymnoascus sp. VKM F-4514 (FW-929)]|nr:hypothetical protein V495_01631 [Pseudogymnoascus sp. VKM F-4514 (FW-929)]
MTQLDMAKIPSALTNVIGQLLPALSSPFGPSICVGFRTGMVTGGRWGPAGTVANGGYKKTEAEESVVDLRGAILASKDTASSTNENLYVMVSYLITGSSRGIGLEVTKLLASSSDADVVFATSRSLSQALQDVIASSGGRVYFVPLEVTKGDSIAAAVREVTEKLGAGNGLDVLINNAGIQIQDSLSNLHALAESFEVNVAAVQKVSSAFLPLLSLGVQRKLVTISTDLGSITNAERYAADVPFPSYKITKAAVNMLMKQFALELGSRGFTVFPINPGWLKTDMGGPYAYLEPIVGAKQIVEIIQKSTTADNGSFRSLYVDGHEFYDGKNLPCPGNDYGLLEWRIFGSFADDTAKSTSQCFDDEIQFGSGFDTSNVLCADGKSDHFMVLVRSFSALNLFPFAVLGTVNVTFAVAEKSAPQQPNFRRGKHRPGRYCRQGSLNAVLDLALFLISIREIVTLDRLRPNLQTKFAQTAEFSNAMANDQYLAGKLAIVTGASKANGIGAATAYSLASHGANIVIHYGKNGAAAAETVKRIESLGVKAVAISVDQQSKTFGTDLIEATLEAFNTKIVDIIINNAGAAGFYENLESVPVDDFDWHFQINVRGPFLLMQASLPYLAWGSSAFLADVTHSELIEMGFRVSD